MAERGDHLEGFGRRLKRLRADVGLTQEELAEVASCSPAAVGKLERGKASPTASLLIQLCHALKVDPHTLLGWESGDAAPTTPPDDLSEIEGLRQRIGARLEKCDLETVKLVEGVVLYASRRMKKPKAKKR